MSASSLGWKVFLAVMLAATVGFVFTPADGWLPVVWQVAVGYVAAGAVLSRARRTTRNERLLWCCFGLGIAGNASGILAEKVLTDTFNLTFPSPADLLYLSLYPLVALGLAMLIRRRTAVRDWGTLVDATTVTTGLGLLAWIFMVQPAASDPTIGVLGHIASVAYPVGDVVLVAMTVRLQLNAGTRSPSFWLMTASLLGFLCGDTAWAVINQMRWDPEGLSLQVLKAVFLLAYALFGVAALHPSARFVAQRPVARTARLTNGLIALLTVAALIAPLLLIFQLANHRLTDGLAIAIGSIVLMLLVVTRMAQLLRQLERQSARVRELSQTDELTGLANRRAWTGELPRAVEAARRQGVPLSVAMLDLDHFKAFNDAYGHPAGDRLLKAAAAAWQEQLRSTDRLARYGGEEFIVLLPDAGPAQGMEVLERLRGATPLGQTFSAGLATWDGAETSDELVARADAALYIGKQAGRNRVILAEHSVRTPRPRVAG